MTPTGLTDDRQSSGHGFGWRSGVGFAWLYLLALIGAEHLSAGAQPFIGLWLHAALVVLMLFGSYMAKDDRASAFLVALAVLPLVRIVSIAVPVDLMAPLARLALVSGTLVFTTAAAARALRFRAAEEMRLNTDRLFWQIPITLVGCFIGLAAYPLIEQLPIAPSTMLHEVLLPSILLVVFIGVSEELFFRGLLLTTAADLMGPWSGIALAGLTYGFFHLVWGSWELVAMMVLVGWLFGWFSLATGSLLGVTLAHAVANVILFVLLPAVRAAGGP